MSPTLSDRLVLAAASRPNAWKRRHKPPVRSATPHHRYPGGTAVDGCWTIERSIYRYKRAISGEDSYGTRL